MTENIIYIMASSTSITLPSIHAALIQNTYLYEYNNICNDWTVINKDLKCELDDSWEIIENDNKIS